MRKTVSTWAGKMPIDNLKLLQEAGYETKDGDQRIRFRMDLSLLDLINSGAEDINDFANDAILAGDLAGTGLSDLSFRLVGHKEEETLKKTFAGICVLEVDASVKDIIEYLADEG